MRCLVLESVIGVESDCCRISQARRDTLTNQRRKTFHHSWERRAAEKGERNEIHKSVWITCCSLRASFRSARARVEGEINGWCLKYAKKLFSFNSLISTRLDHHHKETIKSSSSAGFSRALKTRTQQRITIHLNENQADHLKLIFMRRDLIKRSASNASTWFRRI